MGRTDMYGFKGTAFGHFGQKYMYGVDFGHFGLNTQVLSRGYAFLDEANFSFFKNPFTIPLTSV